MPERNIGTNGDGDTRYVAAAGSHGETVALVAAAVDLAGSRRKLELVGPAEVGEGRIEWSLWSMKEGKKS